MNFRMVIPSGRHWCWARENSCRRLKKGNPILVLLSGGAGSIVRLFGAFFPAVIEGLLAPASYSPRKPKV